ncbi:hypothetical protein GDO81_010854 [Engystomops pustulosus]|uniref:L1 transposable element RRM domain-containing protein n=1 Tax=Engystomops pustulosus TaxID=76066 RepID=A0AAV7C3V2_ENGPU|nr:hypothetical protein GDO81_010854 [Engystomops pustulosus]
MLAELQLNITKELQQSLHAVRAEISSLGERTSHIENKMTEITTAHNDMADVTISMEEQLQSMQAKLADMEDRSRRNNLRFRGVRESVKPDDLTEYLTDYFSLLLPQASQTDLIIDRAHRLPKPKHLAGDVPRDVIVRIHFYHIKEKIAMAARSQPSLPPRFKDISVSADLSAATLSRCRAFQQSTAILRAHGIQYRWGFPVKLLINKNGTKMMANSPEEALHLCKKWNLTEEEVEAHPTKRPSPSRIQEEWSTVVHRKKRAT